MTHAVRIVASVAVLAALGVGAPVQAQTPEIDALRVRAEQGDARAQYDLALRYDFGHGDLEDDAEAVRLYRLAADQGVAEAQHRLGSIYATGAGVPKDYVQAHMWFNLAVSRLTGEDREDSVRLRDLIADQLTPDDLSEAQRLAREWDAAHPYEP
jgi:hypothetical protein